MPGNWQRNLFGIGRRSRWSSDSNLAESVRSFNDRPPIPQLDGQPQAQRRDGDDGRRYSNQLDEESQYEEEMRDDISSIVNRERNVYRSGKRTESDRVITDQYPTFHGTQGESVESHIRRVENFSEMNELREKEKVRYLVLGLKGPAESWYLCMSGALKAEAARRGLRTGQGIGGLTYEFLKEKLLRQYQTPHRKHLAQHELIKSAQGVREDMAVYAARIRQLGEVAYGHLPYHMRTENCTQPFIAGIYDKLVKMQVLSSRPDSFETAVEQAVTLEASKRLVEGSEKTPRERNQLANVVSPVITSNSRNQNPSPGRRSPQETRRTNGIRCHYCERLGHYERECRTKQREISQEANRSHFRGTRREPEYNFGVRQGPGHQRQQGYPLRNALGYNQVNPRPPDRFYQGENHTADANTGPRFRDTGAPNAGQYQGNRNGTRGYEANALVEQLGNQNDIGRLSRHADLSLHDEQMRELCALVKEQSLELQQQRLEMQHLRKNIQQDPFMLNPNDFNQCTYIENAVKLCHLPKDPKIVETATQTDDESGDSPLLKIDQLAQVGVKDTGHVFGGLPGKKPRRRRQQKRRLNKSQEEVVGSDSNKKQEKSPKEMAGIFQLANSLKVIFILWVLLSLGSTPALAAVEEKGESFFICRPGRGGVPFKLPKMVECPPFYNLKEPYKYGTYQLWIPSYPTAVRLRQCFARNLTRCATAHVFNEPELAKEEVTEYSIPVNECQDMWETKTWRGQQMVKVEEGIYYANISMYKLTPGCLTTSKMIIQEGRVGIQSPGRLYSSIGEVENCRPTKDYCQTGRSTMLWQGDELRDLPCAYKPDPYSYQGERKGDLIRLYKLPQILHLVEGPIPPCLPESTRLTTEGLGLRLLLSQNKTQVAGDPGKIEESMITEGLLQIACELHSWQRTMLSLLFDIDPTTAVRLAFKRKDVQAIWRGKKLLVSSCRQITVRKQAIRKDHKIGSECYYYKPVKIDDTWFYAAPTGELFDHSAQIPCSMVPEEDENSGPEEVPSYLDLSIPESFYKNFPSFQLDFGFSDFAYSPSALLYNIPSISEGDYRRYNKYGTIMNSELHLLAQPKTNFEPLYQQTEKKFADLLFWILDSNFQLIVNFLVLILVVIKLFQLMSCLCCCTCRRVYSIFNCPRNRRRRKYKRTQLRERSRERRRSRHSSRHRRDSVLVVGPTQPVGRLPFTVIDINGCKLVTLIDSGATMTVIKRSAIERIKTLPSPIRKTDFRAVSVSGEPVPINQGVRIPLKIGPYASTHLCGILDTAPYDLILGMDALSNLGVTEFTYNLKKQTIKLDQHQIPSLVRRSQLPTALTVYASETITIDPQSYARFSNQVHQPSVPNEIMLFEPNPMLFIKHSMILAPTVSRVDSDNCIPIEVYNPTDVPVTIYKSMNLGLLEPTNNVDIIDKPDAVGLTNQICMTTGMTEQERVQQEEQLQKVISEANANCKEATILRELLYKNRDVFSKNDYDLGDTKVIEHTVDVQGHTPIKMHPYRLPFAQREILANQINEMLKAGLIRPSTSEWSFPAILVKKREQNSWRMVIDYRRLNKIIKVDQYRLPHIDDILLSLGKAKYFSSLDMASGYHQIPVASEDQDKLSFTTFMGAYTMLRMPMGVSNAGATYQRAMDIIFTNQMFQNLGSPKTLHFFKNVFCYLDDVLIASETFEQHMEHLQEAFNRLRNAKIKAKLRKCHFLRSELPFLGYIVTRKGLKPDPRKIEAVTKFPVPQEVGQLRSFLGLASYYRRYIENFGKIAAPLHSLLKKAVRFQWTHQQQEAFETLKTKLTTAPVLAFPDFNKPFIIHTDASGQGIGAILSQTQEDGLEHPVMYASRTMQKTERKYHCTEQEALAVIFALKTFRSYIYQHPTTLYTDHAALTYLLNTTSPNGRVARWGLHIQEYLPQLEIKYRPGRVNGNADALSRIPQKIQNETDEQDNWDNVENYARQCNAVIGTDEVDDLNLTEINISIAQRQDNELKPLIDYIESGTLPDNALEAEKERLRIASERYTVERGLLLFQPKPGRVDAVLEIPKTLIRDILRSQHDSQFGGHLGMDKTYARCKDRFHWPTMYRDVRDYCRVCKVCQTRKRPLTYYKTPMKPVVVTEPWELVGCDIIGPITQSITGARYIVTFCDYFTKYTEAFAVAEITAPTIAKLYVDEIVCRHGSCRALRTDQGSQYTSDLMKEILNLCGTSHSLTPPYSPWCNGQVERFNAVLIDIISQYTNGIDWCQKLRYALFAYNTALHHSTRQSPYFLLFGRDAQLPIDSSFQYRKKFYAEVQTFPEQIMQRFTDIYANARTELDKAHTRQKRLYDRNAKPPQIQVGDLVSPKDMVGKRGEKQKFAHAWSKICRVIQVDFPDLLIRPINRPTADVQRVHVNNVKVIHLNDTPLPHQRHHTARNAEETNDEIETDSSEEL